MAKGFRIQIPSSSPEIDLCEVYLAKGKDNFDSGWLVTKLIPNAFINRQIIISAAINKPNIQISATMDSTKKPFRIAILLGKIEPIDRKIYQVFNFKYNEEGELAVYWNNWEIQKAEWNGVRLKTFKTTKSQIIQKNESIS
ncbi:hypothetical protein ISS86_02920 [Candidatus Microgenomates bacterium]|nr:hypothetical protein [Candidatus Microgenomates bacterium]